MWDIKKFCITFMMASALLDIRTQGSYIRLNQTFASNNDAKKNCRTERGRLLRYVKITRDNYSARIADLLDNGQSVWVDGYASFSPPVAFHGCYEYKQRYYDTPKALDNNGLYICSRHCLDDHMYSGFTTEYIGLTDGVGCYCLNKWDVDIKMRPVSRSLCNNKCNQAYAFIDSCGGHGKISVHKLYTNKSINWARNGPFHEQCVFAKLKDDGTDIEVFTASCYTNGESVGVNGFFCKSGEYSQLSRNCSSWVSSKRYCVVNSSSTWEEARNVCLNYNGLLADLKSEKNLSQLMAGNTGYWLGIYKPFIAADKRNDQQTVCLAATKYDNRLFLEPDNCRREKAYLCETSSLPSTISKKDMSSSSGPQTSPTLETLPTEGTAKESWKTTLENSELTTTSSLGASSPNNLSTFMITSEPTQQASSSTKNNYSTLSEVTLENVEITTTSPLATPLPNNLDTSSEEIQETSNPTEHIHSTLREANATASEHSKIKENSTSSAVGLLEPSGQPRSGLNPLDENNFFAVAAVAFVAAAAVIAVGIVGWVVKRRCHKKSHKRCHKQTHSLTTPPTIPATPAVGNDEPEAYCITGEDSVFRIAMDPNQNLFGGATADQAQFAVQGKASGTSNCTDTHQYQNEGSLRLKETHTYDRLKFKYLNIKYLYEDSSIHKDIHIYDHSCSTNAGLKNKITKDQAIE